jgi:hypothetical protein
MMLSLPRSWILHIYWAFTRKDSKRDESVLKSMSIRGPAPGPWPREKPIAIPITPLSCKTAKATIKTTRRREA